MNGFDMMNAPSYFMEIGQDSLKVLKEDAGLDLPLERQDDGRLTAACRERVTLRLAGFLKKKAWQSRLRVWCAIGARGVSLRRLTLPASSRDDLPRLLLLQIESEFPLPPDELAWGYRPLAATKSSAGDAAGKQELLLVAVKREALEEYAKLLAECGATPVFTLAALARSYLCPYPPAAYAVLDVGTTSSELAVFDDGIPTSVRVLPWGSHTPLTSPAAPPATDLLAAPATPIGAAASPGNGEETALASWTQSVERQLAGRRIYLTGNFTGQKDLAAQLAKTLGRATECKTVEFTLGEGRSAAILGLRRAAEQDGGWPPVVLQTGPTNGSARAPRPAPWKWAALAAGLLALALALPSLESLLLKPRLVKRLESINKEKGRLVSIDRELDFLRYLKQNQPPYLDALFLVAKSAPPGARWDSVSMNRRGDLALRGSLQNGQLVADFRTKLIETGFFTNVAVEEQSPTPDRQKVNVRMSAQWKGAGLRESLAVATTNQPPDKAQAPAKETSAKDTPAKDAPGKDASAKEGPPGAAPKLGAPAQPAEKHEATEPPKGEPGAKGSGPKDGQQKN